MRIAQVAPLIESVPPKTYGGTERIVSYLTEQLVELGHDVTLFASGDSETNANLVAPAHKGLRNDKKVVDCNAHYVYMLELLQQKIYDFDIIHYHIDYFHFPMSRRNRTIHCTTMHGRLDLQDIKILFNEFRDIPLISISNDQRKPLPYSNFVKTVYHGIPLSLLKYKGNPQNYLAFLGRISPEKGLDKAIEIAKKADLPLKIAAKIDKADEEYFNQHIKKLFDHPLIEYVGEINDNEKNEFLGNALALLFPINWPEPFGLVMIESMACGTPVIAFKCGSVPEVIDDGETGYIVKDVDEAADVVKNINRFNRLRCRGKFEERFSDRRMALDYIDVYHDLTNQKRKIKKFVQL